MHRLRNPLMRKSTSLRNHGYTGFHDTTYPVFHGSRAKISHYRRRNVLNRLEPCRCTRKTRPWTRDQYSITLAIDIRTQRARQKAGDSSGGTRDMAGIHRLDRLIGEEYPSFATEDDVRAFEKIPYAERIAAQSTSDAIKLGAALNGDAPAIQFLPNADPADKPVAISYRDFVARVTQAANMFHALDVGKNDVVSFLLPLLPDAFVTLFGAEAAGIANPVNPLLEPHQIAEILDAAQTSVLVSLGPMPGTDIWQKVEQVRGGLKHLKAIVVVRGAGDPAHGIYSFNDLIKPQPSDHLVSGRKISGDEIAAYFHTGGTTGTPK